MLALASFAAGPPPQAADEPTRADELASLKLMVEAQNSELASLRSALVASNEPRVKPLFGEAPPEASTLVQLQEELRELKTFVHEHIAPKLNEVPLNHIVCIGYVPQGCFLDKPEDCTAYEPEPMEVSFAVAGKTVPEPKGARKTDPETGEMIPGTTQRFALDVHNQLSLQEKGELHISGTQYSVNTVGQTKKGKFQMYTGIGFKPLASSDGEQPPIQFTMQNQVFIPEQRRFGDAFLREVINGVYDAEKHSGTYGLWRSFHTENGTVLDEISHGEIHECGDHEWYVDDFNDGKGKGGGGKSGGD